MNAQTPSSLPNAGNLPPVLAPNNSQEGMSTGCDSPTVVTESHFFPVGANSAYVYGRTSLSPASPALWTTYLSWNLTSQTATLPGPVDTRTGSAGDSVLQSGSFALHATDIDTFQTHHGVISGLSLIHI